MPQQCLRCRRPNPREATYCYHDGVLLTGRGGGDVPADGSAMNLGARPFPRPCVLPSGASCANFLQLALALHAEREAALELLRSGGLAAFFASMGRADLAVAARAAAAAADAERGLDDLLGRLPGSVLPPARLLVETEVLDLGVMLPGEDREVSLTLRNGGLRLLYGTAACAGPSWLTLGDGPERRQRLFQFAGEAVLTVRVRGRRLRAYRRPQEGELQLQSNGGSAVVVVRVQVPARPFPDGPLAGAASPRQLAEKARAAPQEAAALIESGAVARWYAANGWTYPVLGPTAAGPAAVQQLFEALGLVRIPQVELSADALQLLGRPGAAVEHALAVTTQENRAAVASATSDQLWLRVGRTVYHGRVASVPLTVPAVPCQAGEVLQAHLTVTANGRQRFVVPVTLTGEGEPVRVAVLLGTVPAAPSAAAQDPGRAPRPPVAPGRLLAYGLLLLGVLLLLPLLWALGRHHPGSPREPATGQGLPYAPADGGRGTEPAPP